MHSKVIQVLSDMTAKATKEMFCGNNVKVHFEFNVTLGELKEFTKCIDYLKSMSIDNKINSKYYFKLQDNGIMQIVSGAKENYYPLNRAIIVSLHNSITETYYTPKNLDSIKADIDELKELTRELNMSFNVAII